MKPKVLVVIGPTATNKTKLAINLANDFNGEIINADVYQTYKDLNIGVNKPTLIERKQAKFHLLDFLSLSDEWDIKRFQKEALNKIKDLLSKKKVPIICGGSSLYIDALVKNYNLDNIPKRSNKFEEYDNDQLFNELKKYSIDIANKNKNNRKRLIRALQIYSESKSKDPMKLTKPSKYDFKIILTSIEPREKLYSKINDRVDWMINHGWKKEVLSLSKYKNVESTNAFKAIGYKTIYDALCNNKPINVDKIKQDTRHYAKRQITWIRHHYGECIVFNQSNYNNIKKQIKEWIK